MGSAYQIIPKRDRAWFGGYLEFGQQRTNLIRSHHCSSGWSEASQTFNLHVLGRLPRLGAGAHVKKEIWLGGRPDNRCRAPKGLTTLRDVLVDLFAGATISDLTVAASC